MRGGELAGASLEGIEGDFVGAMFEIGLSLVDGEIDKDGEPEDEGVGSTDGELSGVSVLTSGDLVGSLVEIGRSLVGACERSIFGV